MLLDLLAGNFHALAFAGRFPTSLVFLGMQVKHESFEHIGCNSHHFARLPELPIRSIMSHD